MNPTETPENQPLEHTHQHGHQQPGSEEVPADAIEAWLDNCPAPLPDHIVNAIVALLNTLNHGYG
jgi:hypothetical protein